MAKKEIVVIIPARGKSKRIRNKNIRLLAGLPLVAHSILQARKSKLVSRVVVSTDSRDIARVSKKYGAEVIRRPRSLAGDKASSESALTHALQYLKSSEDYTPDLIVFLQCTSAIRNRNDIDNAIKTLVREKSDSLLSATHHNKFIWRRNLKSAFPMNYNFRKRPREQDFPEEFKENGSIYVLKPWVLLKGKNRLGGKISIYEMTEWSTFQIDEPEDFKLVEWILKHRRKF